MDNNLELTFFDFSKLTIKDAVRMLQDKSFDVYFDRGRILDFLEKLNRDFFSKYYGREFCPRCFSQDLEELPYPSVKRFYECRACGKRFVQRNIVGTHFEDWVVLTLVSGILSGKSIGEIRQSMEEQMAYMCRRFGLKTKIPDEKTLFDLGSRIAEELADLNNFLILLKGGLECEKIFCDDAFSRRMRRKPRQGQKMLNGSLILARKRRGQFYYVIVVMCASTRFIIVAYPSRKRDAAAFSAAFYFARLLLKNWPKVVKGDKLKGMEQAARKLLGGRQVQLDFQKLKPFEKGELNKIERRIRSLRVSIKKSRKYGSLKVLKTYVHIATIYNNYLKPMKVLGGKTPAQAVGLPYPFRDFAPLEAFLEWARIVKLLFPKILRAGIKRFPGTPLSPSN